MCSTTTTATIAATTNTNASSREGEEVKILDKNYACDHMTNVTPTIIGLVGRNLHLTPHHPITILKKRVVRHFHQTYTARTGNALYAHFDNIPPVVTTEQNFGSLLIPDGHVSRTKRDNYYINADTVLRAHTSAHQRDFIRMGFDRFLVTGDVYRRDEIDQSHYPVFHQMEGVRLFTRDELFQRSLDDSLGLFEASGSVETQDKQKPHTLEAVKLMELHLKDTLVKLIQSLFGGETEYRWNPCYFPFTHPSYELEIKFKGEWMEVLGSGIMRQDILSKGGAEEKIGWAFGLGLDRLAMLLFDIPDIRLLWSRDERFLSQFAATTAGVDAALTTTNITFIPYSKYPPCFKDISFWLSASDEGFNDNDLCDVVRSMAGDLVEKVERIDRFRHPGTGRVSLCYRITYRSMDATMTHEEVNSLQNSIRDVLADKLGVELR